ncbi:hypothetical protein AKO1_012050 [Acrasis kona]|uniref:Uncharacterized protein n=1 Tax=Acrasis kona TaxID=1008807 RepID=A0AAW2ZCM1_9EUKA
MLNLTRTLTQSSSRTPYVIIQKRYFLNIPKDGIIYSKATIVPFYDIVSDVEKVEAPVFEFSKVFKFKPSEIDPDVEPEHVKEYVNTKDPIAAKMAITVNKMIKIANKRIKQHFHAAAVVNNHNAIINPNIGLLEMRMDVDQNPFIYTKWVGTAETCVVEPGANALKVFEIQDELKKAKAMKDKQAMEKLNAELNELGVLYKIEYEKHKKINDTGDVNVVIPELKVGKKDY